MDFHLCTYSVKYTCAVWTDSTIIEYIIACINCCYVKQWQWNRKKQKRNCKHKRKNTVNVKIQCQCLLFQFTFFFFFIFQLHFVFSIKTRCCSGFMLPTQDTKVAWKFLYRQALIKNLATLHSWSKLKSVFMCLMGQFTMKLFSQFWGAAARNAKPASYSSC